MTMAVAALMNKEVDRIILARPAVEAGEKLGFLPGDLFEKINPYLRPLYDALHDLMEINNATDLLTQRHNRGCTASIYEGKNVKRLFCYS